MLVEEEKEDQYNGSPPRPQPRGPRTPPGPPPPDDDDDDEPMPAAGTGPVIGSLNFTVLSPQNSSCFGCSGAKVDLSLCP